MTSQPVPDLKSDAPVQRKLLSRRELLAGSALLIAIGAPAPGSAAEKGAAQTGAGKSDAGFAPNGFLRIDREGRIVLVMPSVEMGQDIYTAEAMLVAEELEVGLDQIGVVAAPADNKTYAQPRFKAQLTGG